MVSRLDEPLTVVECSESLFVAGTVRSICADLGVSFCVAGAIFGAVGISYFLTGAIGFKMMFWRGLAETVLLRDNRNTKRYVFRCKISLGSSWNRRGRFCEFMWAWSIKLGNLQWTRHACGRESGWILYYFVAFCIGR